MSASASRMRCQGGSAAVIVPLTLGSGADAKKLNGVGTALKYVAIETGEFEITLGSSSSGDGEKCNLTILEHDKQFLLDMKALKGVPVLVCAPLEDEDGGGFGYLIGKVTGTIKSTGKGNTFKSATITIVGAVYEKTSSFTHSAINTAVGTLEQLGGEDLDPTDLIADDVTALLTGEVLLK